jgi:hypothetical protein
MTSRDILYRENPNDVDINNELSKEYSLFMYYFFVHNDKAYIFNDRPHSKYEVAQFDGRISWWLDPE